MKIKSKTSKKVSFKTAIIAGVVLLGLIMPQIASAQFALLKAAIGMFLKGSELTGIAIAQAILVKTSEFIFYLLNLLVKLSGTIFDGMLNIGFKSHLDVVKAGWQVTRDFSNMFFILFLVIIAFATILRFEKYGIRQLLPKIILIALLINFSLVICSFIIDFSNVAANFFVKDVKRYTGQEANKKGVSATLTDSLMLTKIYQPIECDELSDESIEEGEKSPQEKCLADAAGEFGADMVTFIISMTMGSLVMLVATFVFLAGALLLLVRIVIVWFLVMLVPLVFICYIMPALRRNWQIWWKTFLQWCFFAPAYAFFVWLAVKVAVEGKTLIVAEKMSTQFTGMGAFVNTFTSSPALIIHYLFIIALLLGGLIAASKFGIYGAGATMNIVQKAGKGAKSWATRTTMRPVAALRTRMGAGALTAGGRLFTGKLGRRMEARAIQLRRKPEERPEHKKYGALLKTMSSDDVKKEMHTKGVRGFLATQEAKKRGILREAERTIVKQAAKSMRAFGAAEEARTLEELRPDAIEAPKEREAAIERAIKEGTHKKWSNRVFESPEGTEIIKETRRQLGTGEFAKTFKGWAKDIQEQAETSLRESFNDDFADTENIKGREVFAKVSGRTYGAFFGDKNGIIQASHVQNTAAQNEAKIYIQGLRDEDFGNLKGKQDKMLAAQHMLASQVLGAGVKLSGKDKRYMEEIAKRFNPDAFKQMQKTASWGGGTTEGNVVDLKNQNRE